jgi:hypothetical protein
VELVVACTHPWREAFARDVLRWIRRRAERPLGAARADASDWQLLEALPRLALYVPPTLAREAADGALPADDTPGFAWSRPAERFLSLLAFRHEIAEELAR